MPGACLLQHGLTASPVQIAPQKAVLDAHGYFTADPVLPGHGTVVSDLQSTTWQQWYNAVVQAAHQLRERAGTPDIYYVGLSLGALLGIKLAIDQPKLIKKIVCIGTPLYLFGWMHAVLGAFRWKPLVRVIPYWPKDYRNAVASPEGRKIYRAGSYTKFPVPAVQELIKLQHEVQRDLPRMTTPLLLMHARGDKTAPPSCAEAIQKAVSGPVELLWLERSRHVATLDYDQDIINTRMLEFFGE